MSHIDPTSASPKSDDATMPTRRRCRWPVGAAVGLLLIAVLVLAWRWSFGEPAVIDNGAPEWPSSAYRNTSPQIASTGSAVCLECHPSHAASLRRTGMGRSMAIVEPDSAPPDVVFDHHVSKRRYQVLRKDRQLWQRETLLNDATADIVLNEVPLKYVIGSGRHAQTFLAEIDGFLVEAPVTWYAARKTWAMSPGYDRAEHAGFQRTIGETCLFCHAGSFETVGGTLHKMNITETAISCERCHGPGALHVERHTRRPLLDDAAGLLDDTIVNPAHLPRALAEAVCQQCHLRGDAAVVARGRTERDFRPGLPLQEFRHDLSLQSPHAPAVVTGQVEQLRLSRCYQASEMTCMTCHEPHHPPRPQQRDGHYQKICLTCHAPAQCTVDDAQRRRANHAQQCVHCHMPRTATEVPHVALTHHRIGKHRAALPASAAVPKGELLPVLEWTRQSANDRKRALGLGYLEVAGGMTDVHRGQYYQGLALELLAEVQDVGRSDPAIAAGLLALQPAAHPDEVIARANHILAQPNATPRERSDALLHRADALAKLTRFDEAAADLRALTALRRKATDWLLLADVHRAGGKSAESIAAFERAVSINPRLWKVQRYLAEHYRGEGNTKKAAFHQERAIP